MNSNDPTNQPQEDARVKTLRDAGFDEAAAYLSEVAWYERRPAAEEAAKEPPVEASRSGVPVDERASVLTRRQRPTAVAFSTPCRSFAATAP